MQNSVQAAVNSTGMTTPHISFVEIRDIRVDSCFRLIEHAESSVHRID
jgi:hypothetical protein